MPPEPPVLDCHTHHGDVADAMGYEGRPGGMTDEEFADEEATRRFATMDRRGVSEAVVIAGHGYLRPNGLSDTRTVNDDIAAYRDAHPSRLPAAVGIVEPLYGRAGLAELDRCRNELGLVGISFHTRFQGVPVDSPWVRRYLERMGELGLVPFVHAMGEASDEALWMVENLAVDLADLDILVLDAFGSFAHGQQASNLAERRGNLHFDTALAHGLGFLVPFVRRVGAERLLYGSDLYSWPFDAVTSHMLEEIRRSDLSSDERSAILGGNARRLLGLNNLS